MIRKKDLNQGGGYLCKTCQAEFGDKTTAIKHVWDKHALDEFGKSPSFYEQ